jgi:enamine deaminase RidA (YjgF/YER057c/UK114 family)
MESQKREIYTSKPIDRKYQYAPAVMYPKAGLIFISGMVGWDDSGNILDIGDPAAQARRAFENLKDVLAEVGGTLEDVVMETEYVVDMAHYKEIGRIRNEYFPINRPAATLVEVRQLFKPELLFEIQAIAIAR